MEKKIKLRNVWDYLAAIKGEPSTERKGLYDIQYEISTTIYEYRRNRGWSQKKLAEVLCISQAMVSKLESGEYNYTVEQLWKISRKLGLNLVVELEGDNQERYTVGYDLDPGRLYGTDGSKLEALGA